MSKSKLLLIEDNTLLRWWLSVTLSQQGFDVTAPASIEGFLQTVMGDGFDVLVTDCDLCDCRDGFQVLSLAREQNPDIVAILISAQSDPDLPERARAAGFNGFLPKPVCAREVAEAIQGGAPQKSAEAIS